MIFASNDTQINKSILLYNQKKSSRVSFGMKSDKFVKTTPNLSKTVGLAGIPILGILSVNFLHQNSSKNFKPNFFNKIWNILLKLVGKEEKQPSQEEIFQDIVKNLLPNRVAFDESKKILEKDTNSEEKLQSLQNILKKEGIEKEQFEKSLIKLGQNSEEQITNFEKTINNINIEEILPKAIKSAHFSSGFGTSSNISTTEKSKEGDCYSPSAPKKLSSLDENYSSSKINLARQRFEEFFRGNKVGNFDHLTTQFYIEKDVADVVCTDNQLQGLLTKVGNLDNSKKEALLFFYNPTTNGLDVLKTNQLNLKNKKEVELLKLKEILSVENSLDEVTEATADYITVKKVYQDNTKDKEQKFITSIKDTLAQKLQTQESAYTTQELKALKNSLVNMRFAISKELKYNPINFTNNNINFDPNKIAQTLLDKLDKSSPEEIQMVVTKPQVVYNDAELNELANQEKINSFKSWFVDLSQNRNPKANQLFGKTAPAAPANIAAKLSNDMQKKIGTEIIKQLNEDSTKLDLIDNIKFLLENAIKHNADLTENDIEQFVKVIFESAVKPTPDKDKLNEGVLFVYSKNGKTEIANSKNKTFWQTGEYNPAQAQNDDSREKLIALAIKLTQTTPEQYNSLHKNLKYIETALSAIRDNFNNQNGRSVAQYKPSNLLPGSPLSNVGSVDNAKEFMKKCAWAIANNAQTNLQLEENNAICNKIFSPLARIASIDNYDLTSKQIQTIVTTLSNDKNQNKVYDCRAGQLVENVDYTKNPTKFFLDRLDSVADDKITPLKPRQQTTLDKELTTLGALKKNMNYQSFFKKLYADLADRKINNMSTAKTLAEKLNAVVIYNPIEALIPSRIESLVKCLVDDPTNKVMIYDYPQLKAGDDAASYLITTDPNSQPDVENKLKLIQLNYFNQANKVVNKLIDIKKVQNKPASIQREFKALKIETISQEKERVTKQLRALGSKLKALGSLINSQDMEELFGQENAALIASTEKKLSDADSQLSAITLIDDNGEYEKLVSDTASTASTHAETVKRQIAEIKQAIGPNNQNNPNINSLKDIANLTAKCVVLINDARLTTWAAKAALIKTNRICNNAHLTYEQKTTALKKAKEIEKKATKTANFAIQAVSDLNGIISQYKRNVAPQVNDALNLMNKFRNNYQL